MDIATTPFGNETWVPLSVIATRLALAIVFGAAVGFEREWRNRPAGLRTHILVCLSATTVALLTIEITHYQTFNEESVRIDGGAKTAARKVEKSGMAKGNRPGKPGNYSAEPYVNKNGD